MGNRVSTNTAIEETTKQLKEEVEIGEDPPGVHPAVLLSVCYWEDPKPITKGPTADESLEEEPQPISVNYDEIIKAVQKSCNVLAQLQVQKAEGYCKRLCSTNDCDPKPVIQVTVTEESSSGWVGNYSASIRSIMETAWSKTGTDYFVQVIDKTKN